MFAIKVGVELAVFLEDGGVGLDVGCSLGKHFILGVPFAHMNGLGWIYLINTSNPVHLIIKASIMNLKERMQQSNRNNSGILNNSDFNFDKNEDKMIKMVA